MFHSPSDIAEKPPAPGQAIRAGRLGRRRIPSKSRATDGLTVTFRHHRSSPRRYRWSIKASCRTCSARVRAWWSEGKLEPGGLFRASEVLAKHDENYMPPEVAEALKEAGQWQPAAEGAAQEDPY